MRRPSCLQEAGTRQKKVGWCRRSEMTQGQGATASTHTSAKQVEPLTHRLPSPCRRPRVAPRRHGTPSHLASALLRAGCPPAAMHAAGGPSRVVRCNQHAPLHLQWYDCPLARRTTSRPAHQAARNGRAAHLQRQGGVEYALRAVQVVTISRLLLLSNYRKVLVVGLVNQVPLDAVAPIGQLVLGLPVWRGWGRSRRE